MMKKLGLLLLFFGLLLIACDDVSDEYVEDIFDESDDAEADFDDEFADDEVVDEEMDKDDDTAVSSPTTSTADFAYTDCPFDASGDIECGTLTVPEDRSDANSPTIELAVAIVAAPDGATQNHR